MIEHEPASSNDLSTGPIRSQLLWSSAFPLILFGLLSGLVIATFLYQHTLDLVSQRNTAQIQVLAATLSQQLAGDQVPDSRSLRLWANNAGISESSVIILIDSQGQPIASSNENKFVVSSGELGLINNLPSPSSKILEFSATNDEGMASVSAITGTTSRIILIEPWAAIMKPVSNYQLLIEGLAILGIVLSLVSLYMAMGRIIRPIQTLVDNATGAVPGSVFHPIKVYGPQEIRTLIQSFNQMVIRLAEQQSALRQYSQKALLSQEEERQRLSHELHDGILQDLVGLSQRVELCRNELTPDSTLAQERLVEIHNLLNDTLDSVRRISIALRPPVLEDFGLTVAFDALCKELNRYKPDLVCELTVTGNAIRLDSDLELAVYRVAQEALTNIRKHVKDVTRVSVELEFAMDEIRARITNDGGIFNSQDVQDYVRSGHLGLAGMYERARLFGGELEINSNEDGNTMVTIRLPYNPESIPV